jgi:hypothetical protein
VSLNNLLHAAPNFTFNVAISGLTLHIILIIGELVFLHRRKMKNAGHCKHLYISLSSFKKRFCKCICLLLDDLEYPLTFQNETKTGRPILQASKD